MRLKKSSLLQTPLNDQNGSLTPASSSLEPREERLKRLKLAIENGTYHIQSHKLADKLIDLLRQTPPKTK